MTTVANLIAFLQTQDPAALVEVIEHTAGHTYYDQGGNVSEVPFDPAKHAEYTDMRENPFIERPLGLSKA